ncbi:unnamed protein product, partial [Ectocarpus sp. 12 AP-2014]
LASRAWFWYLSRCLQAHRSPLLPSKGTHASLNLLTAALSALSLRKSRALFGDSTREREGQESRRPDLSNHTSLGAGRASGSEPVASARPTLPVFSPAARLSCVLPEPGVLPPHSALPGFLSPVPLQTTPNECPHL